MPNFNVINLIGSREDYLRPYGVGVEKFGRSSVYPSVYHYAPKDAPEGSVGMVYIGRRDYTTGGPRAETYHSQTSRSRREFFATDEERDTLRAEAKERAEDLNDFAEAATLYKEADRARTFLRNTDDDPYSDANVNGRFFAKKHKSECEERIEELLHNPEAERRFATWLRNRHALENNRELIRQGKQPEMLHLESIDGL